VGFVKRERRGPVVVAVVALLVIADVAAWVFVFHRGSDKSTYVSQVAASEQTSLLPTPALSPTSAPSRSASLALPRTSGKPLAVSIVGDSIAAGDYVSSADMRYRDLMEAALRKRGAITVSDVDALANKKSTNVRVPSGLDFVVLEVGTDDLQNEEIKAFTAAYVALVATTRKSSPDAALVCAGTWSDLGVVYDAVIESGCRYAGGAYVPLRPLYLDEANRGPAGVKGPYGTSDDVAPNDAGHRAIAAALLGAVGLQLP
jgi:acyl-CoA thioesterase-1